MHLTFHISDRQSQNLSQFMQNVSQLSHLNQTQNISQININSSQLDIILNTNESRASTKQKFQLPNKRAQFLTEYSKSKSFDNENSLDVLRLVLENEILLTRNIDKILRIHPSATILNDSLSTIYQQWKHEMTLTQDIRIQNDPFNIQNVFKVCKLLWILRLTILQ